MAYLGNVPARSFISFERQVFTIVNSQTAYTLSHSVTNENDIRLVVNNVVQEPGSGKAYTATGTTLTLSAALTNGTDEMYCVFLGRAVGTVNAPAGSVGTSQLASNAVTSAKITYPLTTFSSTGIDDNADATAITIDSDEKVGIGTGSPNSTLTVSGDVTVSKAGDNVKADFSNGVNANFRVVTSGAVAQIGPSTASDLVFLSSNAERMRMLAAGGLTFGGDTAAANALDDYEEGTWTPGMTTSGGSLTGVSYGYYNKGWYTKIGRNVTINFNVQLSSKGSGGSGAVRLTGYPFGNSLLTASVYGSLYMYNGGINQPCCTYGTWSTSHVTLRYVDNASGGEVGYSDISNNSSWSGMMTYITNV